MSAMVQKPAPSGDKAGKAGRAHGHLGLGSGQGRGRSRSPRGQRSASSGQGRQQGKSNGRKAKAAPECPLCIEQMDATDLKHKPCPCGYQICLFCYERICKQYSGQCPACRLPYGSQQTGMKAQRNRTNPLPQSLQAQDAQTLPPGTEPNLPSPRPGISNGLEWSQAANTGPSAHNEGSRSELTSWDGSESSEGPAQQRGPSPYEHRENGFVKPPSLVPDRQLGSTCSGSIDYVTPSEVSTAASNSATSSLPRSLTTAEVFTVVGGIQKPVCVPLEVAALPDGRHSEGEEALDLMRRAVLNCKISSREGAVHLMGVLSKIEGESGDRLLSLSELKRRYTPCGGDSRGTGRHRQSDQGSMSTGGCEWQRVERLEDTPSMVVSRPAPSASPISPPCEPLPSCEERSPFAPGPPPLGPTAGLAPAGFDPQPGTQLLWQKKGLMGIDLPMRTAGYGTSGQGQDPPTYAPGFRHGAAPTRGSYDFYGQSASTGPPGFAQHPLRGGDSGFGPRQGLGGLPQREATFSQGSITAGMSQAVGQAPRDMMRSGFGAAPLQSLGSAGLGGAPGVAGAPWGGHQAAQCNVPQYVPPDIAAVRGVGLGPGNHNPGGFGLERGVAPQALHQQVTERLRINGGPGDHLLRGWK